MRYVYLVDNMVHEIIPEIDPVFPGIPVDQRYAPDFLSECVAVEDAVEVKSGWEYIDGTFVPPIVPEPEEPPETLPQYLDTVKAQRIQQTKTDLAAYLESHPLQWTDGNYYSITEEKQNQLSRVFAVYEINLALGKGARLEWNDTGERCREWSKEELSMLASAIDERVRPLVKYQQEKEIEIRGAATLEEVNAVVVDYDTV